MIIYMACNALEIISGVFLMQKLKKEDGKGNGMSKKEDAKMSYEEFVARVVKELRQYLPPTMDDIALKSMSVPLNNNVYRQGLLLLPKKKGRFDTDGKISKDLHEFYQGYQSGISMETVLGMIAQEITSIYEDGIYTSLWNKPYDWVKEHLLVEVCNMEMNRNRLLQMPHEIRENLALKYLLWINNNGTRHLIRITNAQLIQWGITKETLRRDAWNNMKKRFPPIVRSMNEMLIEMMTGEIEGMATVDTEEDILHVITNTDNCYGASYMFDEELMSNTAERFKDDIVIIPSSVHEIIFLPKRYVADIGEIISMVVEVNYSQVQPEEMLSNSVYVFDRQTHDISTYQPKRMICAFH
ncbi:MAG: DUF5688 family protein [Butyrivibrio sp.]|nr:DUF5688 family protein [Butyrivibrio sp.]